MFSIDLLWDIPQPGPYSSSLLNAINSLSHLRFFKTFSNFVHFYPIFPFVYVFPFFSNIARMTLLSRVDPVSVYWLYIFCFIASFSFMPIINSLLRFIFLTKNSKLQILIADTSSGYWRSWKSMKINRVSPNSLLNDSTYPVCVCLYLFVDLWNFTSCFSGRFIRSDLAVKHSIQKYGAPKCFRILSS